MLYVFSGDGATNGLFAWAGIAENLTAVGSDGNEPGEQPPTSDVDIGSIIVHPPRIVSGVVH